MGVLFIDNGQIRTYPIDGETTIGRDAGNSVVVAHPTVSRHHARIEMRGGFYHVVDEQSRNGTRVNGKVVKQTELLADGARLRIGHVRAWFYIQMPQRLPRSATRSDNGIVFSCNCGTRLWSASDTVGITVTCGQCNAQIEVPPVDDDDEPQSAKTVSGVKVVGANTSTEEKKATCNVCQWPIEKDERMIECKSCKHTFHAECWKENKGCASYGCDQVNILSKPKRPSVPTANLSAVASTPGATAGIETQAQPIADEAIGQIIHEEPAVRAFAWDHALLAMAVMGSLLGILAFGVPAAVVAVVTLGRMVLAKHDSRLLLLLTFAICLLGAIAGVSVSQLWFLNKPPFDWLTHWPPSFN